MHKGELTTSQLENNNELPKILPGWPHLLHPEVSCALPPGVSPPQSSLLCDLRPCLPQSAHLLTLSTGPRAPSAESAARVSTKEAGGSEVIPLLLRRQEWETEYWFFTFPRKKPFLVPLSTSSGHSKVPKVITSTGNQQLVF